MKEDLKGLIRVIKTKQRPQESVYKFRLLRDITNKIFEAAGNSTTIQTFNKAFDKVLGKHEFGPKKKTLDENAFKIGSYKDEVRGLVKIHRRRIKI